MTEDDELVFPGIVKSPNCRGLVAFVVDRFADVDDEPEPPGEWGNLVQHSAGFFSSSSADLLKPGRYYSGTPITWTRSQSTLGAIGLLYELTD